MRPSNHEPGRQAKPDKAACAKQTDVREPDIVQKLRSLSTDPTLLSFLDTGYVVNPFGGKQELHFLIGVRGLPPEVFVDRIAGCLVGGVIGNALGKLTRRLSAEAASERLKVMRFAEGQARKVTSDAVFMLATAEGLLRADSRQKDRGICSVYEVVLYNYRRLLAQQGYSIETFGETGWLLRQAPILRPGNPQRTTYRALLAGKPIPKKGSGAVVRTAPCGFFRADSYELGYNVAGLTHSSFAPRIAGGLLAVLTERLLSRPVEQDPRPIFMETFESPVIPKKGAKLKELCIYACSGPSPTPKALGGGWEAAQALALACEFTLGSSDFSTAVRKATSFGGDHDTVGCITGCLAGALYGYSTWVEEWMERVELFQAARELAADIVLYRWFGAYDTTRYPPH